MTKRIMCLIALFIIIPTVGCSSSQNTGGQSEPQFVETDSSNMHLKVLGMDTQDAITGENINTKSQGIFKIVHISVTNNQKAAITLNSENFKLLDDQKREYDTSAEGSTAYASINSSFKIIKFETVNSGDTLEGYLVYDVPKDAKGIVLQVTTDMTGEKVLLQVE